MSANGLLQMVAYLVALLAAAMPLGAYMARVYAGQPPRWTRFVGFVECGAYRFCGVRPDQEMNWRTYALAMLAFNALGFLAVYVIQRLQGWLPLNPQEFAAVRPDTALNTAASFATNTNWQSYSGETTLSYFTQMAALTVQNFVSAATGMAVLVAMIRGFARQKTENVGNFWVDLTRSTLYVLLPLATVLALVLVSQGVVQNLRPHVTVPLLEAGAAQAREAGAQGAAAGEQQLAVGPAASQVAIKQLGTNGGGFFNANSAHPFENPTPLSNFLEVFAILLIAAALCNTFGLMVGDVRQGWALLAAMVLIFVVFLAGCWWAEASGNPRMARLGVDQTMVDSLRTEPGSPRWGDMVKPGVAPDARPGGNMEGKEVRFGIANSALWATATTSASNGSVNSLHDSYTPLGGLVPMVMMQLGEVVFGGAGSGLYGMLAFVLVAAFVAGLMVGRTPEYLGKKIGIHEMKMASLMILIPPALVLTATALAVCLTTGVRSAPNPGAHGFSEILYAFSSMSNNNGSAFAGLDANTPFYNSLGALAMLVGRYWLAIPALAIAGSLARKKITPAGAGTLPTHTPLFVGLLIAVVLLVGALTFLPALALGPILEHLQMVYGG